MSPRLSISITDKSFAENDLRTIVRCEEFPAVRKEKSFLNNLFIPSQIVASAAAHFYNRD
jgi:hypothetical protein